MRLLPPTLVLAVLAGVLLVTPRASAEDSAFQSGVEALREKDPEKALGFFRECLRIEADSVPCHWEIGWAFYLQNDWDQVVHHWERVQELEPQHTAVGDHLATAKAQQQLKARIAEVRNRAPSTVSAPIPEGTTVRLRSVGDVMLGTDYPAGHLPPNGGAGLLEDVLDWLQDADLTFANLEGPFCDRGHSAKCAPDATNCYAFRTPTSYADYLVEAGIDLASTANNHAGDFGSVCRDDTHALLDSFGIAWSGPPGSLASVESQGLRVGLVAFHTSPSSNHLNNSETASELIQLSSAENDLVVVSFHGGAEGNRALHVPNGRETFYGEDRGNLREFARMAIDSGADLVLGHGPHVPRGMEIYKDRLVAYSLGNFATYGRFNLSGNLSVGFVLETELAPDGRFLQGKILPTKQQGRGIPKKDNEGTAIDLIRSLSLEDFPETAPIIAQDGQIAPKVTP